MELKEFISQTLTQIIEGVKYAQEQSKQLNATINPELTPVDMGEFRTPMVTPISRGRSPVFMIDFDVVVIAAEDTEKKVGGGLNIPVVRLNAQGATTNSNSQQSRIKFMIPISLPLNQ